MEVMQEDFDSILQLEQAAANGSVSLQILTDLKAVITPPVRLMYMSFESDNFDAGSPAGTHVLEGMLRTLPDSKIVEDLHGHVRIQRNSQKNKRQTVHQIQELVTQSKVLSERNIRHPAAVDRNCFVQMFKRTPDRKRKRRYFASVHQLPERWSTIMGRKNWGSLSEEVLLRGAAAFAFLKFYKQCKLKDRGVRVQHGLFSKFATELTFLSFEDSQQNLPAYVGFVWVNLIGVFCYGQLRRTSRAQTSGGHWTPRVSCIGLTLLSLQIGRSGPLIMRRLVGSWF